MLPPTPRKQSSAGRKRLDERRVLTGILYILGSGLPWEMLPREMGCGSGMTCWRRARDWHEAGIWSELEEVLRARLGNSERLDFSRVTATFSKGSGRTRKKTASPFSQGVMPHVHTGPFSTVS